MTQIISALSDVSDRYQALFVDLWGCVHDGVRAYPDAVAALLAYRAKGGTVVLVTNSPKPRAGVTEQLKGFGVPDDAWDTIATSGDSARSAMYRGAVGEKVWFMGEEQRDAEFFEPLNVIDAPRIITRVPLEQAEGIVCCGPFDV
ncbi:MAG: TIGR01459 family HAD-type hydrolase, partial [Rhodobacteraceae bacterium]|nr:TIGR01459 family HAD-type hydrolase [Paracoccaceae bacterium]